MVNAIEFLEQSAQGQLVALLSLGLVVSFGAGVALDDGVTEDRTSAQDSSQWEGVYTVEVERDGEVVYREKEHNILTDQGANWIRSQISANNGVSGDTTEAEHISVGNESAPSAGDTVLPGEIQDHGLSRTTGTTDVFGTGEFQVQNTFQANLTDGQELVVNTTGLNYEGIAGSNSLVSGGSFPDANLLDGDQLTVTHNVTIQDGGS
ncbi:MAG: hypothetical protein BRC28_02845 [Nanohaloarchaea archaeon SW_4_43_9]|nr:MAG: hypothetical protein BRC28_02845 [Nanohaloarchaea archaeon SW_4_43_9]